LEDQGRPVEICGREVVETQARPEPSFYRDITPPVFGFQGFHTGGEDEDFLPAWHRLRDRAAVFFGKFRPAGDILPSHQKQRLAGNRFVEKDRFKVKRDILDRRIRVQR
jgi:hypothetical protein